MLDKIKLALRISHNALDTEIEQNINTALLELSRVGVNPENDNDLVCKCVELYCKFVYDFDGKGESYYNHFCKLRDSLSLSGDYHE